MKNKLRILLPIFLCITVIISTIIPVIASGGQSLKSNKASNSIVNFTKLNYRSVSGDGHASKSTDGDDNMVTFKRNYASANTWSGGALQLKTDDNAFYKLTPDTSYVVKFDYCVESYKEAADADFKDLSIMVATSKQDEGTWTNVRSVSSRDLDSVAAAHKGEKNTDSNVKASTTGEYAAVGAKVQYNAGGYGCDGTTHSWKTVTAQFTTKDTLTTASDTYDILSLALVSHKTDAGDVQVSFKNVSVEIIDLSTTTNKLLVNNLPDEANENGTITRSVDKSGDNVVTFSLNYPSENAWTGGALQLKYDNGDLYKYKTDTSYSIKFDYCVESYKEAADAQFKDLSIMVAASKEGENGWWNARSIAARDLDQITFAHKANEAATSGEYAAIGARVPYNAGGYGCDGTTHNWKTVSAVFTTKDTLTTASGTYDVLTLAMISNKTAAGDFKVSFKNLSIEEVDLSTSMTKLNATNIGGSMSKSVDKSGSNVVTFSRNYASANTWSGGTLQLKADNNEYYKLQPSTTYNVKFDYCVESYKEAADADFKDLSIMVATSKQDEGIWYNARSVSSRDLDSVADAHKGEKNTDSNVKASTTGEYAAVGAKVPYNAGGYGCDGTTHSWKTVTAQFTTKDTLTTASGTYDILSLAVVSHKTDAGDIKVSFKDFSIEIIDLSKINNKFLVNNLPDEANENGTITRSVDKSGDNVVTFSLNYPSENAWTGGALQLKYDNGDLCKLEPSKQYSITFDYCVDSYLEAADAQFKDLSIMVAASKEGENGWWNARSITARDLDQITFAHKANEAATSGDYAAIGARVPYNAGGYGCDGTTHNWKTVSVKFITKDTLTTASGTYDVLTLAMVSNKTAAGDFKVSFKNLSIVNLSDQSSDEPEPPEEEPTHDPIYFYNAIPTGMVTYKYGETAEDDYLQINRNSADNATGFQLKKDENTFYKLEQYKGYRVSFSYKVDNYAQYRDYGNMYITVGGSVDGESAWWEVRNLINNSREAIGNSVRDKNKYPGVVISAETSGWVDAEVSFDIYNPITNIVDDSKVYDNLTFLVLSGDPNGSEKVKTTIQFKNFKVEEVQLDKGDRTFVFDTMGGKDITSLDSNIRDFENLILPTPSKDGSRFRGWYLDNSCTTLFSIDNFTADDSGNIYLYAGWQQLETGLNFQFNTVKKPHYYYEDLEEDFSDYDEEDIVNNAKKIIKKRKKLVRVASGDDSDDFPTTLVVILSIVGALVIAGGITSFIIIRKKHRKI